MVNELIAAVKAGDAARVSELLDAKPDLAAARTPEGVSVIALAYYHGRRDVGASLASRHPGLDIYESCITGDQERLRFWLDKDPALLNSYSTDGYTPIALACFFNHEPLVRLLADRGADVNAASSDGHRRAPIHAAASGGSAAILDVLLKHGADPNARQETGFAAAHSAAANGNIEMLRLLAEHGADLQARSEKGEKPLDFAQRQNRAEAVKFLEELK